MNRFMPANDAPSAKLATAFVSIEGRRYTMLMAKDFEANGNIKTSEVPILGTVINGRKPVGMAVKFKMTIYKCTEIFDAVVEQYKETGLMPLIDIQVSSEDPATSTGRTTKVYTGCVLDGDVLLSMFDAGGEFVEQTVEGYAQNFTRPEQYANPKYM